MLYPQRISGFALTLPLCFHLGFLLALLIHERDSERANDVNVRENISPST